MDLSGFNFWELVVAALSTFVIGFIWYGKALFGRSWQDLVGLSDEDIKNSNMALIFSLTFILNLLIAAFLSFFTEIAMMLGSSAILGGLFAAVLCIGFVVTTFGINYLFARKPIKLFFIDAGYMVVCFFVMGLIIGAWY